MTRTAARRRRAQQLFAEALHQNDSRGEKLLLSDEQIQQPAHLSKKRSLRTKSAKQSKPRPHTLKEKAKLEREEHQAKPKPTARTPKKAKLEDEEHKAVKANSTYYFHI